MSIFGSGACSGASSFTPSTGFGSSAQCSASNNAVKIQSAYSNFDNSKVTTLSFSVTLTAAHTCTDSDYVYVVACEPNKGNSVEVATVSKDFIKINMNSLLD